MMSNLQVHNIVSRLPHKFILSTTLHQPVKVQKLDLNGGA